MGSPERVPTGVNAEDFAVPVLEVTQAWTWASDLLSHALVERKGVAVLAPKGAGKTVAMTVAVEAFTMNEAEEAEREQRKERRIELLGSPKAEDRGEFVGAIWHKLFGVAPVRRVRRRAEQKEDSLLEQLIDTLIAHNVAVLVFDEAEHLSQEGLEVIRDIISRAEAKGKEHRITNAGIRAYGVGVVLLGTEEMRPAMAGSNELGQRWVRVQDAGLLSCAEAAAVYAEYLDCFRRRREEIGNKAWEDFIRRRVALGGQMAIRRIENHVRSYVRRMVLEGRAAGVPYATFEAIPYDDEMFFSTLNDIPLSPN